jgi:hypothetical protein
MPGIGFLDHVQQHVRVLVLRRLGPVTLGVGIGRDMERVARDDGMNVVLDILCPLRVDL